MLDVLASFRPDSDQLLRRVSRHVDDSALREIANADYGYGFDEFLAPLIRIRDHGDFDIPMRWEPREVLELIRWSEPDIPNWSTGSSGVRGHWMRGFACVCLLRAAGEPENEHWSMGLNTTLVQLIDSLKSLADQSLYQPAAAFLAWLIPQMKTAGQIEEVAFLYLGLFWFALHLRAEDALVIALAEKISSLVSRQSDQFSGPNPNRWLLGTTFYDLLHAKWERLGRDLIEVDLPGRSPAAVDWIRLIGAMLAGK